MAHFCAEYVTSPSPPPCDLSGAEMWAFLPAREITNKRNAGMNAGAVKIPLRNHDAETKSSNGCTESEWNQNEC